jgi:hypothetical protein
MEHNVVTLETAKKLKAAGFPQGQTMLHYSEGMENPNDLFLTATSESSQFDMAAPLAQEIADQLPEELPFVPNEDQQEPYRLHIYPWITGHWIAAYMNDGGERDEMFETRAPTMAEALALLWLKLTETGDGKAD